MQLGKKYQDYYQNTHRKKCVIRKNMSVPQENSLRKSLGKIWAV